MFVCAYWSAMIHVRPQGFLVWSALVNIRGKALVSSVGFRKRMTSRSPRGIYNVCLFDGLLMLLLRSCTDLSDDLTVCSQVLSCFFDHPSIDSNKKMSLSPFLKRMF